MVVLLAVLILIYNRLSIGRSSARGSEKYLVHLPMSIYLGWISIATIANVTAVLVYYKWNRFGIEEQVWAIVMTVVGIRAWTIIPLLSKGYLLHAGHRLGGSWDTDETYDHGSRRNTRDHYHLNCRLVRSDSRRHRSNCPRQSISLNVSDTGSVSLLREPNKSLQLSPKVDNWFVVEP